jgi:hypothetical protein
MFLHEYKEKFRYVRKSKLGIEHEYFRFVAYVVLRCDNCDVIFHRKRSAMDPKRLNNNYFHVCTDCDAKKFAQNRAVTRKKVWKLTASSNIPISKL